MAVQPHSSWERHAEEGTRFTAPGPGEAFFDLVPPEGLLLDLGCGYGRTMADLFRRGYRRVVGVDAAPAMLRKARAGEPDAGLAAASAGALPFADGAFDAVIAVALFTCIPDLDDQRRAADEIFRVLRPGGVFCASFFLLNRDARNRARYRRGARPGSRDWGLFRLEPDTRLRHHSLTYLRRRFRRFRWLENGVARFETMGGHTSRGLRLLAVKEAGR